jgi:regulatory protein
VPTVSALRPTRREGRVSVHLDGRFAFAVGASFVVSHGLFVGLELSDEQCAALRVDAGADRVLIDAYRLLAHRARSRTELAGRLRAKGYDEPAVAATLERLQGDGLIDDRAFAAAFVADKRRLSGWGAGRIAGELARLGVEPAIVEAALPQSDETRGDELARARAALERRGPARPPLEPARKRAYEFLVRRGYASAIAYQVVREWSAGSAD